jgi:hypothetical protein
MGWSWYLMAGTRSGPGFQWLKPGTDQTYNNPTRTNSISSHHGVHRWPFASALAVASAWH